MLIRGDRKDCALDHAKPLFLVAVFLFFRDGKYLPPLYRCALIRKRSLHALVDLIALGTKRRIEINQIYRFIGDVLSSHTQVDAVEALVGRHRWL